MAAHQILLVTVFGLSMYGDSAKGIGTDLERVRVKTPDYFCLSGYVLMEAVAVDRSYHTWYSGVNERLKTFGIGVLYLVSDRAKALIKLAQTGLGCLSIPDLFHLSHDLAKGYALAIFGRLRQATQALTQAKKRLESLHNSQADRAQVEQAQALVAGCAQRLEAAPVQLVAHPPSLAPCRRDPSDVTGG